MTASQYKKQIDELFSYWQNKDPNGDIDHSDRFIKDGVVCPEKWFSQEVRPLFLFKEAYTTKGDNEMKDLIKDHLIRTDKPIDKMWERVSDWTRGLMFLSETGEILPFASQEKIKFYGNEYIQKIAVMNIKKSSGAKESERENLLKYADYDAEEIYMQLEICDPTVIVCGYTGEYLIDYVFKEKKEEIINNRSKFEQDHYIYKCRLNGKDIPVVNFWHPANHFPDIMNYYCLMNIIKSIM